METGSPPTDGLYCDWLKQEIEPEFREIIDEFDLLSDGLQRKHIYACFGMAAFHAQCFEVEAKVLLILHGRAIGRLVTREMVESMEGTLARKTLGNLIHEVRKLISFDDGAEKLLLDGIKERNFLMHDFFEECSLHWVTVRSRRAMVERLARIASICSKCDRLLTALATVLAERAGVSKEIIENEQRKRLEEAETVLPPIRPN